MNHLENAKLSKHAAYIAKRLKMDAAALLTVKDNKVQFFFGSEQEKSPDEMKEILQIAADGLAKIAKGIEEKTAVTELIKIPKEEEEEEESAPPWGNN